MDRRSERTRVFSPHTSRRAADKPRRIPRDTFGQFVLPPSLAAFIAHPAVRMALLIITVGLIAFVLSRGVLMEQFAPLGVAFVAACALCSRRGAIRRLLPSAALAGAFAGYLTASGAADGLKYCAACVLCVSAAMIFATSSARTRRWFGPVTAGGSLMATNFVYLLAATVKPTTIALFICEVTVCAAAEYFYSTVLDLACAARDRKAERPPNNTGPAVRFTPAQKRAAVMAACASIVAALEGFVPFAGMSLGRTAALYLTMAAAAAGSYYGCAAGLIMGFVLDLARASTPALASAYALAGLFAGCFSRFGPFPLIIAFTAAHAAFTPWVWADAPMSVLYESFAAGVIYYLSNKAICTRIFLLIPSSPVKSSSAFRDVTQDAEACPARRIEALRGAFAGFVDCIKPAAEQFSSSEQPYTLAVERVCRGCEKSTICWRKERQFTSSALEEAAVGIMRRGRADTKDFSPRFAADCIHFIDFMAEINAHLALRNARARYRQRAKDDTSLMCAQYDAMARMLEEIAAGDRAQYDPEATQSLSRELLLDNIGVNTRVERVGDRLRCLISTSPPSPALLSRMESAAHRALGRDMRAESGDSGDTLTLHEAEFIRACVGVGLRRRRGEKESGDSAAYFRTDDGKLYLIISDGMGSGPGAAKESADFARLTEGFLRAGVSPQAVIGLLSPAYAVKCGGDTFTTADILRVDLYTGEAESWKCGAAPTYVRTAADKRVTRITSRTMPAGLARPDPDYDHTRFSLRPGDTVIMVSDGLGEGGWLEKEASDGGGNASELARRILIRGSEISDDADDMTVLAVKFYPARAV